MNGFNMNKFNTLRQHSFLMDLISGADVSKSAASVFSDTAIETLEEEISQMQGIIRRLREQLLSITTSLRHWKDRHTLMQGDLEREYSSYEGVLCIQDFRQHWILYRRAMEDYLMRRRLLVQEQGTSLKEKQQPKNQSKKNAGRKKLSGI